MSPRSNPPPDSRPMQADVPRADVKGMSGQIIRLGMDPALVCSATHLTLPLRLSLSLSIYFYFYLTSAPSWTHLSLSRKMHAVVRGQRDAMFMVTALIDYCPVQY